MLRRCVSRFTASGSASPLTRLRQILLSEHRSAVQHGCQFYDRVLHPYVTKYLAAATEGALQSADKRHERHDEGEESTEWNQREGALPQIPRTILRDFCTSEGEMEPFVTLMMKTLWDAERLEDVRFLFALAIREIPRPTVTLFNTYLLCISYGDTFTVDELDTLLRLMEHHHVAADAVTRMCVLHLRIRCGDVAAATELWPETRTACEAALSQQGDLPFGFAWKLGQLFAAQVSLHREPTQMLEAFEIVRKTDSVLARQSAPATHSHAGYTSGAARGGRGADLSNPKRVLSVKVLQRFLQLATATAAISCSKLREILLVLVQYYQNESEKARVVVAAPSPPLSVPQPQSSSTAAFSDASLTDPTTTAPLAASSSSPVAPDDSPMITEALALRLMRRALQGSHIQLALAVRQQTVDERRIASPESERAMTIVTALIYAKNAAALRHQQESTDCSAIDGMWASLSSLPSTVSLQDLAVQLNIRLAAGSDPTAPTVTISLTDNQTPLQLLLDPLTSNGMPFLHLVQSRLLPVPSSSPSTLTPSVATRLTLNVLVAAYAKKHHSTMVEELIHTYFGGGGSRQVKPDEYTYEQQLLSYSSPRVALEKAGVILKEMSAQKNVPASGVLLARLVLLSLEARNVRSAVTALQQFARYQVVIPQYLSVAVLKLLLQILDVEGIGEVVRIVRATNSPLEERTLVACVGTLRRWGHDTQGIV